jgi:DNA-binding transcriptional regulator YiaG
MKDIQHKEFKVLIPNESGDAVLECVSVMIPVKWDEELQDFLLTPEAHQIIDDTKARHMGLLLPEEIKLLRQGLGLTQDAISKLLQIGEKSWVRWESGNSRPSRSINVLLRALFENQIQIPWLKNLKQQKNSKKTWYASSLSGQKNPEAKLSVFNSNHAEEDLKLTEFAFAA